MRDRDPTAQHSNPIWKANLDSALGRSHLFTLDSSRLGLMVSRGRKSIAPRSNLIASAKLSNYQIKKILSAYAYAVPAVEAAKSMTVSYHSIRTIYALIRVRMIALGLYPFLDDINVLLRSYRKYRRGPPRSPRHVFIAEALNRRRGVLNSVNVDDHIAELHFWYLKPPNWTHDSYAERHRIDIIRLIQLSGPINRPVSEEGAARARIYLDERRKVFGKIDS